MSAAVHHAWTPATYLKFERASDQRHEYIDGAVYAMTGASANHNLIVANVIAGLHAQLRQRDCLVYPSDMRLKVHAAFYTYPDVMVVCGAPHFDDDHRDTLLNPVVIIEVLSPSTENYDRGRKFQNYRTLATLQEYVLVAQDSQRIERYLRHESDQWLLSDVSSTDETLSLTSIDCALSLADVYEKVSFEAP